MIDSKTLGRLVQQARRTANLTKVQLARRAQITAIHLRQMERGKHGCTMKTFNKLLAACGYRAEIIVHKRKPAASIENDRKAH